MASFDGLLSADDVDESFWDISATSNANVTGLWGQHWQKSLILTTCCLSMLGSALIVSSWVLFRDLRSRTRHILTCLSIADFGVALANGVGVLYHDVPLVCKIQGGVAAFSACSSFLWTLSLAAYLYSTVVWQFSPTRRHIMASLHIVNWGIPLVVVSSAAGLGILGGDPGRSTAWQGWWCCLSNNLTSTEAIVYVMVISEVWAYLAYLLIPFFFLVTRHYILKEAKHFRSKFLTSGAMSAAQAVDRKLAILPMIFILLHLWTSILCIEQIRHMLRGDTKYNPAGLPYQIFHLLQGIGDSAQGFANAVFFCVLTKKVRSHFGRLFRRCLCCPSLFAHLAAMGKSSAGHDSTRSLHTPPPGDSIQTDVPQGEERNGERQPLLANHK